MAKELAGDADLWLPAELLEDDFFLEEKRLRVCGGFGSHESSFASVLGSASDSPADSAAETESDEEDYLAGLTRRMTHSFLPDDDDEENTGLSALAAQNPKVDGENLNLYFHREDVILCVLPLFHICSLNSVLLCGLRVGAAILISVT